MSAIHSSPARPSGPRTHRSASPLPPTAPLAIRKQPKPSEATLLTPPCPPPARSLTPKLGLAIPGANSSSKPPLKLSLSLNTSNTQPAKTNEPDSPSGYGLFTGGYYGGPALAPQTTALNGSGDTTIRPELQQQTIGGVNRPQPLSMDDLSRTIRDIETRSTSTPAPESGSSSTSGKSSEKREPYPYSEWNDDIFVKVSRLGEGAGGAVHEVRDTRTGVIMARKTIQTREAPMKQLLRELNLITTISHPNIIYFYGAYMSPSSSEVKVVMEVCEGKSLEAVGKRIRERGARVGEKVAGRLAEGILQGLAYLRVKGLIHRDIKPSNILLSREGVVKLCDFGVSGELVGSVVDTFTGTSLYMAPERLSGLEYSIRADVWSMGLSLLELVQNRFPFSSDLAPIELMIHITQSEPPQLEDESGIHWSDAMKDFIQETLRVDPNLRPTPKDLLSHDWILKIMAQDVNMARWIREVWGWPKPQRKSKDAGSSSRPSTGSGSTPQTT